MKAIHLYARFHGVKTWEYIDTAYNGTPKSRMLEAYKAEYGTGWTFKWSSIG